MTTPPKPATSAPTSDRGGSNVPKPPRPSAPNTSAALGLSMGWQLLVVFVVPLVGGHLVDVHFDTAPWGLAVGGVLTVAGTIAVVTQTVRQLNVINGTPTDDSTEDKK